MDFTAGKLPKQERVDRAEDQIRIVLDAFHVVSDPLDLGCGEVRVQNQSGLFLDQRLIAFFLKLVYDIGSLS